MCRARTRQLFARKFGEKGMIRLSTYVFSTRNHHRSDTNSLKHIKLEISSILSETRLNKRGCHISTTMARQA